MIGVVIFVLVIVFMSTGGFSTKKTDKSEPIDVKYKEVPPKGIE